MGVTVEQPVKLHIGSGRHYWPGWVNVDANGDADVRATAQALPYDPGTVDEIAAIHVLEHIPRLQVEDMLFHWFDLLKPGGTVWIEVPCLNKMAQFIVDGEKNMRLTLLGIFGDPRDPRPDMLHAWAYTKEELRDVLLRCNYVDVEVSEPAFHIPARDMRVTARKP